MSSEQQRRFQYFQRVHSATATAIEPPPQLSPLLSQSSASLAGQPPSLSLVPGVARPSAQQAADTAISAAAAGSHPLRRSVRFRLWVPPPSSPCCVPVRRPQPHRPNTRATATSADCTPYGGARPPSVAQPAASFFGSPIYFWRILLSRAVFLQHSATFDCSHTALGLRQAGVAPPPAPAVIGRLCPPRVASHATC